MPTHSCIACPWNSRVRCCICAGHGDGDHGGYFATVELSTYTPLMMPVQPVANTLDATPRCIHVGVVGEKAVFCQKPMHGYELYCDEHRPPPVQRVQQCLGIDNVFDEAYRCQNSTVGFAAYCKEHRVDLGKLPRRWHPVLIATLFGITFLVGFMLHVFWSAV